MLNLAKKTLILQHPIDTFNMDRSEIEEMAKDLIPLAESTNASEAVMSADYDDKWEFFMGFRKKKKYRT